MPIRSQPANHCPTAKAVIAPEAVAWLQQRGYINLTIIGMADDAFLTPLIVAMRDENDEEWGCAWPYALRGWGANSARPLLEVSDE